MMKKKILIVISLLIILLLSCVVNESTSKLTIVNKSDIEITNIKIGETVITWHLAPGASYDYYIYSELKGRLSTAGATSAGYSSDYSNDKNSIVERKGIYTLKVGWYYFYSEIFKRDGKYYITLRCEKQGFNYGEDDIDEYANGDYYED